MTKQQQKDKKLHRQKEELKREGKKLQRMG